jgi:hypothetical protein
LTVMRPEMSSRPKSCDEGYFFFTDYAPLDGSAFVNAAIGAEEPQSRSSSRLRLA